jgi:hypothetical protein
MFVTVRDRAWREIPPTDWRASVDPDGHTARLEARHRTEGIDFEWQGMLEVAEDLSAVRFAVEGHVLCDMDVCRVGLVLLHPAEFMIGSSAWVRGEHDTKTFTVDDKVYPQPIVDGVPTAMTVPFTELSIERTGSGVLHLRFDGDLFELEDQRNWGDASFKIYCTPLRLGFPRRLKVGTSIRHSVEGHFVAARLRPTLKRGTPSQPRVGRFPAIGREIRLPLRDPAEAGWKHLHVDVDTDEQLEAVDALLKTNARLPIELGLEASQTCAFSEAWARFLDAHGSSICRFTLYGAGVALPSSRALDSLESEFRRRWGIDVPILAATRGHFVELNRGTLSRVPAEGVAFPLSHTVHGEDAITIAENVGMLVDMAATLRQQGHLDEIAVCPLGLFHPSNTDDLDRFPRRLIAPWLVATLIDAALARVSSVILGDSVVHALSNRSPPQFPPSLQQLLGFEGWEVWAPASHLPCGLHAVVLQGLARRKHYLLAANLMDEPKVLGPIQIQNAGGKPSTSASSVAVPAHACEFIELQSL